MFYVSGNVLGAWNMSVGKMKLGAYGIVKGEDNAVNIINKSIFNKSIMLILMDKIKSIAG